MYCIISTDRYDIIIVGAGAAGLMAAYDLLYAGYKVCMLEASSTVGGRIATVYDNSFTSAVETGAEFVHGKLPLTLQLLQTAGIAYLPVEGNMITVHDGKWQKRESHDEHWDAFMRKLGKLKADISIEQFLKHEFAGEQYAHLRNAVRGYAEGFDLANIQDASALAAQREWSKEEEEQYRIPGGYSQLISFLLKSCEEMKAGVFVDTPVTTITYDKDGATVHCSNNRSFTGSKIIVTVAAGQLQRGNIKFEPLPDPAFMNAFQQLGFGDVIKFLLEFDNPFWTGKSNEIGFILSNEPVPTWWTQLPVRNNLLTGWLGGPAATLKSQETEDALLALAIQSLSVIFKIPGTNLRKQLLHHRVVCWRNHAYIGGGYSYICCGASNAKKILSHPLHDILFFAGEALYQGQSQGTVEAALQSGRETAASIMLMH